MLMNRTFGFPQCRRIPHGYAEKSKDGERERGGKLTRIAVIE